MAVEKPNLVGQWLEKADYDLSAAETLLKSGHLLSAEQMLHQTKELVQWYRKFIKT